MTGNNERRMAANTDQGSEQDTAVELEPVENLGGRPSLYSDDFPDQVRRLTELRLPLTERQLARFFGVQGHHQALEIAESGVLHSVDGVPPFRLPTFHRAVPLSPSPRAWDTGTVWLSRLQPRFR
jgi:hypothetical protein